MLVLLYYIKYSVKKLILAKVGPLICMWSSISLWQSMSRKNETGGEYKEDACILFGEYTNTCGEC